MMKDEEKAALELDDERCFICGKWINIEDGFFVDNIFVCFRCFFSKEDEEKS